jgi:hypothetical protein
MQTDAIVSLKIHNDFVLEAGNGAECGVRLLYHDSYAAGWTIECCAS